MAFKWALIKRILQAFEIQKENPPHLGAGNKLVTKDEIKNRAQVETHSREFWAIYHKKRCTSYQSEASTKTQG